MARVEPPPARPAEALSAVTVGGHTRGHPRRRAEEVVCEPMASHALMAPAASAPIVRQMHGFVEWLGAGRPCASRRKLKKRCGA